MTNLVEWLLHWQFIRRVLQVLRPTWLASVIMLMVVIIFQVDQTIDVLRETMARGSLWSSQQVSIFLGVLTLALWGWYFPRALLSVRYWNTPQPSGDIETARFTFVREWYPRLIGGLSFFAIGVAFWRSGHSGIGSIYIAGGIVFMVLLWWRRAKWLVGESVHTGRISLDNRTFIILLVILTISFCLLAGFLINRVLLPQMIGSAAIVLYAAASWIAFGSLVLIHLTYRFGWPSLTVILILLAGIFGFFNDNHRVRTVERSSERVERQSVEDHFRSWIDAREGVLRNYQTPYQVFVIAAEGGGIRAAYWTASVLAKLEEENPGFVCHVYAISGVSGGSLGAAVFDAIMAERLQAKPFSCSTGDLPSEKNVLSTVRQVLSHDFLSPTIAGMLFPDLMERLLPFNYRWFVLPDRAAYLEEAWEKGWEEGWQRATGGKSKRFAESFEGLWKSDPAQVIIPSLLMNGTWVDTGSRAITTNLDLENDQFLHADSVLPLLKEPIPLSTAVHMSARFTYVSPPATLELNGRLTHIVDGGYFENSGARTAAELLRVIKRKARYLCNDPLYRKDGMACAAPLLTFIPIIITNDDRNLNNHNFEKPLDLCPNEKWPNGFVGEIVAPWLTLYNTRSARGYMEERALEFTTNRPQPLGPGMPCALNSNQRESCDRPVDPGEENQFYRYALGALLPEDVPLGWMLSRQTRERIDAEVDGGRMFSGILSAQQQFSHHGLSVCHKTYGP